MKRLSMLFGLGSAALAVAGAVWMGRATAGPEPPQADASPRLRHVRTAPVEQGELEGEWQGFGPVRAGDRAALAFTVGARMVERPVDVGDRVKRGQVLATLDARAFRHAAKAAQADLERAETQRAQQAIDAERLSRLGAANAVPREQVQRIESALRTASAGEQAAQVRLDEARRALSETVLRAPFDAVVSAVHLQPGEMAAPGAPVIVLSGSGAREVEIEVPIGTAAHLEAGTRASVELPLSNPGLQLPATIRSVGAAVSERAGLLPVVVSLDAQAAVKAVPGDSARVRLQVSRPAALSVPAAAIVDPSGQDPAVLRVVDGQLERVTVRLGSLAAARVSVHETQLSAGDAVVVSGAGALRDGDRVRVLP